LTERALLTLWVAEKGRVYACAWAGVMLVAGISQIYGESLAGGRDALVLGVGVVHRLVLQGELWRLVVGPFLHASFLHWLGNFVMLTFVGAIAGALLGRASALVFLLGSSCGALAGTACSVFTHADAYVGVSAGIFALMGWCAGAAFRRPCLFPIAFRWTASCFALLSVAAAWLTNPNASNIGHVAGALFGLLGGAAFPPQAVSRGKPGA
jgi:membrane associated rhomboid family serine protease